MKKEQRHLADWQLERLALGELPPEELEKARALLQAEEGGAARLEALARSDQELMARLPPALVAEEVARRHRLETQRERRSSRRWTGWQLAAPGLAAFAALLLVVRLEMVPGSRSPEAGTATTVVDEDGGGVRVKGLAPQLHLYRQKGDRIERLEVGAPVRTADLLQLSYVGGSQAYGVIFSIDGAGNLTRHLPESGSNASRLDPSGEVRLPHSYELDDAPGFERFFLVTSAKPFPIEPVLEAGRTLARSAQAGRSRPLELPQALEQSSFLVIRENP